jgi:hypothetical protein
MAWLTEMCVESDFHNADVIYAACYVHSSSVRELLCLYSYGSHCHSPGVVASWIQADPGLALPWD